MDATKTIFKQSALLFVTALVFAATGQAQTQISASASSVSLSGSNQSFIITLSTTSGAAVPFTIQKPAGDVFYNVYPDSLTAPTNITVTIQNASLAACQTHSCTGSFVVHPSSGGGTDVTISVTFTPGSGGGGGTGNFVVFSNTPVAWTISTPGQSATAIAYASTSTGSSVSCNVTSSQTWLSVSPTSLTLSGVSQPITLTANSSFLGANSTNNATVTVSCPSVNQSNQFGVTLTIGTGSGGGTGSLIVSPSSVTLSYPNGTTTQSVGVTSTTLTSYNWTTSTTSGGAWLRVNNVPTQNQTFGPWPTGSGVSITVDPTVASQLAQNGAATYTGQVVLSNPNNAADTTTIPVFLNVNGASGGGGNSPFTVNPTNVLLGYPNYTAGGICSNVTAYSSCSVQITSSDSNVTTFVPYINSSTGIGTGQWLSVPVSTLFVSQGLPLSLNSSVANTLPAGNYTAEVWVCPTNSCNTHTSVNVTLLVGSGGGTGSIAAPTSLGFAYQIGKNVPPRQQIMIAGTGNYTVSASTTSGGSWLKIGSSGGIAPGTLDISVDPVNTALTAGTYQGSVSITTTAGTVNIPVSLLVTNSPVVIDSLGSLTLNTNTQYSTTVSLYASDNSNQSISVSGSASWITVAGLTSTLTPASFNLTINAAGLCNGLNTGSVNISAPGAANSTDSIPIVVLVSGSSATNCGISGSGNLTFNPNTAISFTAANNTSVPVPSTQSLTITSSSFTSASVATVTSSGGNWLLINNVPYPTSTAFNVPSTFQISANPAGLANGTYNGQLLFSAGGVNQAINVTLVVGGGSGNVSVSPTSITVSAPSGTTPSGQSVTVSNSSGSSPVTFTVTTNTTSGGSWLSVSANGAVLSSGASVNTPATLTININPAGLTAGQQYSGNVVLSPSGGSQVTIPVTFTVQSNAVVSATPTSLSFRYTLGDSAPATQAVSVTGTGSTPLPFNATVQTQSGGNWLTVTPASGNTPATLNVGVNTAALTAPGNYAGTIVVAGTGTATGSTTINVSINVAAPLVTISQIGNAASYAGAPIAPGEIITIFGTGLGPTPAATSPTVDSTGKVTTTLGGVQVLINGFACPMIYASATQISAIVPYEIARFLSATVVVQYQGQSSNGISAAVAPTAPGIFTANASGTGPGAILNGNLSANSPGNPAAKGETIAIYMTGEGQTSPGGVTGKVTTVSATPPLTPQPLLPIGVTIDGQPATVTFFGEAPSLVSGVLQLNVVIPTTARTGNLPLVVNIGSGTSQAGVTVSVK